MSPATTDKGHFFRDELLQELRAAFVARDPDYNSKRKAAGKALDDLLKRFGATAPAKQTRCVADLAGTIRWLTKYAEDWGRIERLLAQMQTVLEVDGASDTGQDDDGSWTSCCEEFYRKLEPTIDALQSSRLGNAPPRPLRFMQHLQDPETLMASLYAVQISDIARTGRNRRDELGALQSAMSQLIFKDEIRDVLDDPAWGFTVSADLEDSYRNYVRQTQNPMTGFWGPWYRLGDRLFMVQDLSFTFHQIHYLAGNVDRWDKIIDTTLAIRDLQYPMGWRPAPGTFSNHHNYDVVTIFAHGWPHMSRRQRALATEAIGDLLRWCLTQSVDGDGFRPEDGPVGVEDYYFGVRFLDRAGYWSAARKFWRGPLPAIDGIASPAHLAARLSRGFGTVDDGSELGETVRRILDDSVRPVPAVPRIA